MVRTYQSGISLLELVIAFLILATSMVPLASVMGYGGRATLKDNRQIVAIQIMQQTAGQVLQAPYKEIPVGDDMLSYPTTSVSLGTINGSNGASYTVSLTCSEVSPIALNYYSVRVDSPDFQEGNPPASVFSGPATLSLANCLKRLTIRISWTEAEGRTSQIQCLTYRADLNRRGAT